MRDMSRTRWSTGKQRYGRGWIFKRVGISIQLISYVTMIWIFVMPKTRDGYFSNNLDDFAQKDDM